MKLYPIPGETTSIAGLTAASRRSACRMVYDRVCESIVPAIQETSNVL